jgi:uncharacterized cofD-like protein
MNGAGSRAADGLFPRGVVALGGGTGLPSVLRGFRSLVSEGDVERLTAVVAMSDDGGSSGRLRRLHGVPPPGDVRNCLVALSQEEDLVSAVFQHRYEGDGELGGHNLGNLILAALAEKTGSFLKAVEVSSRVLRTHGRILPVTLDDVSLEATLSDGSKLVGESAIGRCRRRVVRLAMSPASARPTPGVIEAIGEADLVVLGPGSLFTSVVSNLVLRPVAQALRDTRAIRILVGNLVSDEDEAPGLALEDHMRIVEEHCGGPVVDALLVNEGPIDRATLERYRAEGAAPLTAAVDFLRGVPVVRRSLVARDRKLRHDSGATVAALLAAWKQLSAPARTGGVP